MFTGIVQAVGRIEKLHPHVVATGRLPLGDVRIGDSISVQGCCLTVVEALFRFSIFFTGWGMTTSRGPAAPPSNVILGVFRLLS